ncbi:A/G-specific adenine glycosylase [Odoribacter lunatus]|uniref:A/G-specific adenine glycosylase n=1 Tax=Odoribacter lunatus TaxID=2941335 RepID=UPI002041C468|nr:A/G-specific adenine glycosylase [Odoribacter lunatus]
MKNFFSGILLQWYEENRRDLPWRNTTDPYLIWISEIILQQTRVVQGMDYYFRFVERFPDIQSLAEADEDEVLKYWQGLGYYSRARNLHAAARDLMTRFGGCFPESYDEVRSLKGIGAYTAAAVCSFAWRLPYAVVDGNVYRVLSRVFGIDTPIDSHEGQKRFAELASSLLDKTHPDLYNQAIMDFGAIQCLPQSPDCLFCPFRDKCEAYLQGKVAQLPVKAGKTTVKPRYFNYLDIRCGDRLLLSRRSAKDIWQNLYEFPLIETERDMEWQELVKEQQFLELFQHIPEVKVQRQYPVFKHVLSHRIIYARFYTIEVSKFTSAFSAYLEISESDLEKYAFPRLITLYLEKSDRQ